MILGNTENALKFDSNDSSYEKIESDEQHTFDTLANMCSGLLVSQVI